MSRRRRLRLAVLAALLLTAAIVGVSTQWRFQAIALKLRGELPTISWLQIAYQFTGGDYEGPGASHRGRLARLAREDGQEPCPALWSTPFGDLWGTRRDQQALEMAAREQLIERIYHNPTVGVEPGDVVLDVGGHLGTFTRFSLDRGAGKVIVLEPEPRNAACLRKTFVSEIDHGEVVVVEAAAWRSAGVLQFRGEGLTGHVDREGEVEVRAVILDETVAELGLERVDFIKMDIEGAELDALAGARATLSRFAPRMAISIYHRPEHPREIPRLALSAQPQYRLSVTDEFAYFH